MNAQSSLDFWEEISIPQWMIHNTTNLNNDAYFEDKQIKQSKNNKQFNHNLQQKQQFPLKRTSPIMNQSNESYSIESIEENKPNNDLKYLQHEKQENTNPKNKQEKRCQNSRKYRERKKEYIKSLENQNRFLKYKVDELSLRIQEMQREINKLKHVDYQNTQNFHTVKSKCFEEIEELLNKNVSDQKILQDADQKLNKVLAFDSKQKIDYLNYFISQLLQNVINDRTLYFVDCTINKRGMYRQGDTQLRKIDIQVMDILKISERHLKESFLGKQNIYLQQESKRLKQLWKKLYQVYLAILNQGMRLQRVVQPMKTLLMKYVKIEDFLLLELHFQKNKYRSDLRYIRNTWYRQIEHDQGNDEIQTNSVPSKKYKISQ